MDSSLFLPTLLHTWLQKMEESPEGLPPGLAKRAKVLTAATLRQEEQNLLKQADELARIAHTLEENDDVDDLLPKD